MDKLLKPKQVAEILNIHVNTLYRYIDENKLKVVRIGGLLRIKEEDLQEFVSQSKKRGDAH